MTLVQVYLVTELLLGGELLDAVLERGSYSESDARLCFAQLLSGIDYLHSRYAVTILRSSRGQKIKNVGSIVKKFHDLKKLPVSDF